MPQEVFADPSRRSTNRQVYRRRRLVVFGFGGALLAAFLYVFGSLITPVPATAAVLTHEKTIAQTAAQLAWPGYGSGGITAPDYSGATEFHGSDKSMPIASMTKTITALVVLEKKPLKGDDEGPTISFTQKDVEIWDDVLAEGGSWAPVKANTSMSERETLAAMLLPSANNYAISLTNWSHGSSKEFVKAANDWLAGHGFTDTKLTSPDGLDAGNVSTTKDLIGIGKLALESPIIASIVSQKKATFPGAAGEQDNTNALVGVDGVDGIKTGNTEEAGYCLLFSAEVPVGSTTVRVIGVLMGAADRSTLWEGVKTLLASMKDGFHEVEVAKEGQVFGSYTTPWGATSQLVATTGKSFLVWSDTPIAVKVTTRDIQAGAKGDGVGDVSFTVNGKSEKAELALAADVPDPGFGWRLAHPGGLGT